MTEEGKMEKSKTGERERKRVDGGVHAKQQGVQQCTGGVMDNK